MSKKITTTKNAERRREEAAALHGRIIEQVEALRESGAWEQFLRFAQVFHRYSINNLLLIQAQKPEATQVAGYRTWQKVGRQVRKGERGLRIFGGRDVFETVEDEQTGEDRRRRRTVFFPVSVFDKSQTDLTDPAGNDPADLAHRLTGDDPMGIYAAVEEYLTGRGWTVKRDELPEGVNGSTAVDGTHQVRIEVGLSPAQAAKTLLHEAAHVILHAEEDVAEYVSHRGIKETEAESVAYVVAGLLGLDTSAYSIGYVAGWSRCEADVIKETAGRVLRATRTLADAITETAQVAA